MSSSSIQDPSCMLPHVDLVDASRDGGVQNHSAALANALVSAGLSVTLHCPRSSTLPPCSREVLICHCISWGPNWTPKRLRRLAIVTRFVFATSFHLSAGRAHPTVLHVQGQWKLPLFAWLVLLARVRGRRVVHTPHNTFVRSPAAVDARLLLWVTRSVEASIVFSEHDRERISEWAGHPVVSPLVHVVPMPTTTAVRIWRERFVAVPDHKAILLAGQIRRDKGLSEIIDAAARWPAQWRLVMVGPDAGGLDYATRYARAREVTLRVWEGYAPLDEFAAAMAASDVVICPYLVASQSGVLDLANRLGVPTAATNIGGLAEQADITFAPRSPDAMNSALETMLKTQAIHPKSPAQPDIAALVSSHKLAYRLALDV